MQEDGECLVTYFGEGYYARLERDGALDDSAADLQAEGVAARDTPVSPHSRPQDPLLVRSITNVV